MSPQQYGRRQFRIVSRQEVNLSSRTRRLSGMRFGRASRGVLFLHRLMGEKSVGNSSPDQVALVLEVVFELVQAVIHDFVDMQIIELGAEPPHALLRFGVECSGRV